MTQQPQNSPRITRKSSIILYANYYNKDQDFET